MQILKMDFQSQSTPPVVPVMQSDAQSRFIGIALYDGGAPYAAPENAAYTVQYHGPGPNNMGWYDTITLSSGTRKAVTVDSTNKNIITLELAEQALRVNGNVFINLCVVTSTGYMLHTFPILCRVTGAAYVDPVAVRSFFYVTGITSEQWLAYVTACQDAQKRAEAAAATFETDPTLSVSGKAADAAKVGEAINAEAERAKGVESQLKEDLVDLSGLIGVSKKEYNVETTINTDGRYWLSNKTNSWGTNENYVVTDAVSFLKGQTIEYKAYGENGVALFVETTGKNINQIITGISVNFEKRGYLSGKYTFKENANVSFSYNKKYEFVLKIEEITNKVAECYEKVDEIEAYVNYIPMFRNIGIVGDSLSSGEIAYTDDDGNHYIDRYDSSWLSIIGRNNGISVKHYSQGGMTTKAWLENAGELKNKLLNDNVNNAYFIALATNDISETYPLGNLSDTKDANSFVGYFKNIIDVIKTKAPNSVIFLMPTYADGEKGKQYSNMISQIAGLYDYCFYIDFVNNTDIYTGTGGVWSNLGHFTSLGYVKVAKTIEKLINKIVDENKEYFKFFTLNN